MPMVATIRPVMRISAPMILCLLTSR
jgi:hypothetical protein